MEVEAFCGSLVGAAEFRVTAIADGHELPLWVDSGNPPKLGDVIEDEGALYGDGVLT